MRNVLGAVFAFGMTLASAAAFAQAPKEATDALKPDIEKVLASMPKGGDSQLLITALSKGQVGVGVVHWLPGARGVLTHSQVDEFYYMLEGTGTLLTGGTIADGKPLPSDGDTVKVLVGPSTSGTKVNGGTTRKIGPGDIVVIPAGVPHQWLTVDSDMKYLDIRIDPDGVLQKGYVNPNLKK